VFGVPDEEWGEVPVAAVVVRDTAALTEDVVKAWIGHQLRSTRIPAYVWFVPELPRTDTGKILRRVLRAEVPVGTGAQAP